MPHSLEHTGYLSGVLASQLAGEREAHVRACASAQPAPADPDRDPDVPDEPERCGIVNAVQDALLGERRPQSDEAADPVRARSACMTSALDRVPAAFLDTLIPA